MKKTFGSFLLDAVKIAAIVLVVVYFLNSCDADFDRKEEQTRKATVLDFMDDYGDPGERIMGVADDPRTLYYLYKNGEYDLDTVFDEFTNLYNAAQEESLRWQNFKDRNR